MQGKDQKEAMNTLVSHLSENEVSAMDRKGIKDHPMGIEDHFQPKRGQYYAMHRAKSFEAYKWHTL